LPGNKNISLDLQNNMAERYTWDSDHQPRYNDILEERIRSSQNSPGVAFNLPDKTPMDAVSTMSGLEYSTDQRCDDRAGSVMALRWFNDVNLQRIWRQRST
jgi:uncharacterized protein YhjY with autotransporter beta-barrel domain